MRSSGWRKASRFLLAQKTTPLSATAELSVSLPKHQTFSFVIVCAIIEK